MVISEGEYTASLLIGTHVFLLYYFDMLQDFVMCWFCFLVFFFLFYTEFDINGELH